MKNIFLVIIIACLGISANAQQEYSMHFLRDVWNSNYTNPGLSPYQTFFIGGTSVGTSFSLKGLGDTPLFREVGTDTFGINFQEIIDNVSDDVRLRTSFNAEAFAFGFKVRKLFFSFNTTTKVNAQIDFPNDIFQVAWRGNEAYIGETVNIGPGININAYQELGLGVNYSFNRKISAGVRVKRLIGLISANTSSSDLLLSTGEDYYSTNVQANYVANISSPFLNIIAPFDGRIENTRVEFNEEELDKIIVDRQFPGGNAGWGFDLGASVNLKDRLELSASVLDLGYIDWTNGVSGLKSDGQFNFEGMELSQAVDGSTVSFASVYDSLRNLLVVEPIEGNTFRDPLAPKIYLSALLKYGYWQLGGMWYNEFSPEGLISSIGLSGRYVLDGRFSFGAVFAYHDNRFDNLGVNGTMRLGPLQFHLLVDNIFPLIRPEYFEYTNIRAGVNIVFGTKKMKKFRQGRMDQPEPPSNPETN